MAVLTVGCSPAEPPADAKPAAATEPSPASAASATWNGVYSSTTYNDESGDRSGMELEVRTQPQPSVVFTLCEGGCSGGKTWPAVIDGRQISFSVTEQLTDQDGKPVQPVTMKFVGRLDGDLLTVRRADAADTAEDKLARIAQPEPGQTAQLGCGATAC